MHWIMIFMMANVGSVTGYFSSRDLCEAAFENLKTQTIPRLRDPKIDPKFIPFEGVGGCYINDPIVHNDTTDSGMQPMSNKEKK